MLSRFEHFTANINEVSLYWHRIASAAMKEYGMKGSRAIYFVKLYGCPQGLTAAELCTMCGKDKADVSREIGQLEKQGLVKRISGGKGGYRAPILLTEKGLAVAENITEKAALAAELVGQALNEEEREIFYRAFDKISQGLRTLSETGLPEDTNP